MGNRQQRLAQWVGLTSLVLVGAASAADLSLNPGLVVYNADGFVSLSGEIRNNTAQTVCTPQVEVLLMDASSKPITVKSIVTETKAGLHQVPSDGVIATRHWLPAGEVAVFTYLRDRKSLGGGVPAKHQLNPSARTCDGPLPTIAVDDFKDQKDGMGYHTLSGVLRNSGKVPCRSPKVVLGFYDAGGQLIDTNYIQPDAFFQKKLAPGKSVKFSQGSISSPEWGKFANFKVWGDCESNEP